VRGRIRTRTRYPLALQLRGVTGRVELKIALQRDGSLESAEIRASSGRPELDALALEAVREAAPYEPFSSELKKMGRLSFSLPIDFRSVTRAQ
jgi:TonB family protein